MQYIKPLELKGKFDRNETVIVVDIREHYELDICKFRALHIPMETVTDRISELDHSAEVVVVCKTGRRAEAVTNLLIKEHNFKNVKVSEGGIIGWIEQVDSHLETY